MTVSPVSSHLNILKTKIFYVTNIFGFAIEKLAVA